MEQGDPLGALRQCRTLNRSASDALPCAFGLVSSRGRVRKKETCLMARSIWKRTLVTLFASAGLAWAQQPMASSDPRALPAQSTAQTFTVQEPGKVGQKCKVLKTWKTADGKTAYQVQ